MSQTASAPGSKPIEFQTADEPLLVSGDARRIEQVLLNLIGNAINFTGGRGPIEVSVRCVDALGEIQVCDHGPGIPAQVLPRIFERFYRVEDDRSAREGLGLGLYIAREIVTAHGGHVDARSNPGEGATFIVTLPLLDSSNPPSPPNDTSA